MSRKLYFYKLYCLTHAKLLSFKIKYVNKTLIGKFMHIMSFFTNILLNSFMDIKLINFFLFCELKKTTKYV